MPRKQPARPRRRNRSEAGKEASRQSGTAPGEIHGQEPVQLRSPEADKYIADLLARGEAVYAGEGALPPGVTHEIVGRDEQGRLLVRRKRFSAY